MTNIKDICVTIGIPFYNSEKTIGDTIRSVFAQTHQNWKLILINDGSTDNAGSWVSKIKDDRVTYLEVQNKGYLYWLNYIISITETEYLARMDGDDIMDPQRIEKQLQYLVDNPKVDLIDSGIYTMDLESRPVGIRRMHPIDLSPKALLRHSILTHPAVMGKTAWFKRNQYDQEYYRAEDQELWCRTAPYSTFSRITEPLLIYREGKVKVSNYAMSIASTKKIISTYGGRNYSSFQIKMLLAQADAKLLIYRVLGFFGKQDFLARKRSAPLTAEQEKHATLIIHQAQQVRLPGVDQPL